jgi:hypothetical protein
MERPARVKAEFPLTFGRRDAILPSLDPGFIRDNKPYDLFVRELLTGSGSNFRDPPANFYRAMQNREPAGIAQTVALTFMGTRAETGRRRSWQGWPHFFLKSAPNDWRMEGGDYLFRSRQGDQPIVPGGAAARWDRRSRCRRQRSARGVCGLVD